MVDVPLWKSLASVVEMSPFVLGGNWGVLHRHANLGPYNTEHLLTFLGGLQDIVTAHEQLDQQALHPVYVIVWDNVSFHHAVLIREWFTNNQRFIKVFLPPYSLFLNPIEEFFSAWRWKVYDRQPYNRENLLEAMEQACDDITVLLTLGLAHQRVHPSLPYKGRYCL